MKMVNVAARKTKLYEKMIRSLGDALWTCSDTSKRPLVLQLIKPYKIEVTIYLFLGTNPPGGRRDGEYKITLTSPDSNDGHEEILRAVLEYLSY